MSSSSTSQKVKEELGYDASKDKGLMSTDPRNINLAGAEFKQGQISQKPAAQPDVSSSAVTEGLWRSGESVESERWR